MSKKEDDKLAALRRERSIYNGIYEKLWPVYMKAHGSLGPLDDTCAHCRLSCQEIVFVVQKLTKLNEKIKKLSKNEDGYQLRRTRWGAPLPMIDGVPTRSAWNIQQSVESLLTRVRQLELDKEDRDREKLENVTWTKKKRWWQ